MVCDYGTRWNVLLPLFFFHIYLSVSIVKELLPIRQYTILEQSSHNKENYPPGITEILLMTRITYA